MDKKIKALFFDIDGTLVSFSTHKIPQSTVDALENAKRNGVAVYISTGRPIMLINNLGQIERLIDGYITTNGARCFVGNHTVCLHPILRADVDEVDDLKNEEVLQLTPFCSAEQEADLMLRLSNCTSGRWHPAFTDITSGEADKGKGLQVMAEYLGLDISETMAFGDGGNDISIIREAGIGVAMGNANEEVKAMADYVTSSVDEDGVKNALVHFGIIQAS